MKRLPFIICADDGMLEATILGRSKPQISAQDVVRTD